MQRYEVRFGVYQYNTGRGDNGVQEHHESFSTIEEANEFAKIIKQLVQNRDGTHSHAMADRYVASGFVSRYIGTFEVVERKLD